MTSYPVLIWRTSRAGLRKCRRRILRETMSRMYKREDSIAEPWFYMGGHQDPRHSKVTGGAKIRLSPHQTHHLRLMMNIMKIMNILYLQGNSGSLATHTLPCLQYCAQVREVLRLAIRFRPNYQHKDVLCPANQRLVMVERAQSASSILAARTTGSLFTFMPPVRFPCSSRSGWAILSPGDVCPLGRVDRQRNELEAMYSETSSSRHS
jgi:hypothetical protein